MSSHVQHASILSGRSSAMAVVIGLHLALISAALVVKTRLPLIEDVRIQSPYIPDPVVEDVKPAPVVDAGGLTREKVVVSLPMPTIPLDPSEDPLAPSPEADPVVAGPAGSGTAFVAPTALVLHITRSTDDYYPPAAVRLGEEGVTEVRVCVSAMGELLQAPTVAASSGFRRLDLAAVLWATDALRFTPATQDGQAIAACKGLRVKFNLK
jgi:TonB family protein